MPRPEVNTRAVLQLTHGISEHSGRYDRFARFLAKNGFRVYASDLRGHGLSVPQSEVGKAGVQFWADTTADMIAMATASWAITAALTGACA